MRRLGLLYDGWLRRAPVLTKSVTSAALFGLGDRIAQRVEKSREPKDRALHPEEAEDDAALVSASTARTMRMMIWGSVLFAPIAHTWVNFVERTVGSHGKVVVFKKMLLDMFVLAPGINTLFFTTKQLMEGKTLRDGLDFAADRLPQTLKANYTIWPIANSVNYGYVPLQYRILFINCVNLVWTTVLSTISSRPALKGAEEGEAKDVVPASEAEVIARAATSFRNLHPTKQQQQPCVTATKPGKTDHNLPHDPFKACAIPRPIGWISTVSAAGEANLAPYSQFNNLTFDPPYVMFSANQKPSGKQKDTTVNTETTGKFCWNLATWDLREAVNITAEQVAPGVDEFERAGLKKEMSRHIQGVPMVADSPVKFEREYYSTLRLPGNPPMGSVDVIIGKVVAVHIKDEVLTDGILDVKKTKPIARCGYYQYTVVKETFEMVIPSNGQEGEDVLGGLEGSTRKHREIAQREHKKEEEEP